LIVRADSDVGVCNSLIFVVLKHH